LNAEIEEENYLKLNYFKIKKLEINEMLNIEGGTNWLAFSCGAGVALSIFTGGIGALVFGPSTAGLCIAAATS
jgi:hypothetical protein